MGEKKYIPCGTGTLTLMLKRVYPEAHITGLDGDPQALDIAGLKLADRSVSEAENSVTLFGPLSLWRAVKGD